MTNVLPPEAHRALLASIRDRWILTGALVFLVAALVALAALVPTYLVIQAGRAALPPASLPAGDTASREARTEAARLKALLNGVMPLVSATSSAETSIRAVLTLKPQGISIDRISYNPEKGITLSGTALSRDAVNAFRAALEKDTAHISSVSVPVASILGVGGGRFSVDITLAK